MRTLPNMNHRTVQLAHDLYPRQAIEQACAAYSHLCQLTVEPGPGRSVLSVSLVEGAGPHAVNEFLSYLLCAALETHLTGDT